ncbi:alkaline phosphatase family protein [Rhizomicrobium electricum]|nr:alkaline phosphatase family protein [Rhizomicrobium electricum]NIJ46691.1 phospholipase C [Rhizomicrobium electricum]
MGLRNWLWRCGALPCLVLSAALGATKPAVPHYDHIFVLMEENKGIEQIMGHPDWAPNLNRLAAEYGLATQFYAEVHPSEANYIALLGGDTFGVHDDDAFFCKPGPKSAFCAKSDQSGYVDHNITARSLMDQLGDKGLTWKSYMEDIPGPGSLVPAWPSPGYPAANLPNALYAAKHSGFVNFRSVNSRPYSELMSLLVGFNQLDADLASGTMPNFAIIVPNQCNEMHGRGAKDGGVVPEDCRSGNLQGLIHRGDAEVGRLVKLIMASPVWSAPGNSAIVVSFDENGGDERLSGPQGCCGYDPNSAANFGGGRIMTLVITNHGPHQTKDPTPYNHYSLLRTIEDAFGIPEHLGHAGDTEKGVVSMSPLFAVRTAR